MSSKGMKIRPAHATMANFVTLLGGTMCSRRRRKSAHHRGAACRRRSPSLGDRWGGRHRQGDDIPYGGALYVTTDSLSCDEKDKYNQMSDRQKKAIDDKLPTRGRRPRRRTLGQVEDAGVDKVKAEKVTKSTTTPVQTALWKNASSVIKTGGRVKKFRYRPDAAMRNLGPS